MVAAVTQLPLAPTAACGPTDPMVAADNVDPRVLMMGLPYANPRVPAHPPPEVHYPIHDPYTGTRPRLWAATPDVTLELWEQTEMQTCMDCDANSAMRRCPRYK